MRWRRRGGLTAVLVLLIAGWVALAVAGGGAPDGPEFGKAVARSAQAALSSVRTAHLSGQAELNGRVTRPFLPPLLDTAVRGVTNAQQELVRTPPPSLAAAGTRDELLGLLYEADRSAGDLVAAVHRGDDVAAVHRGDDVAAVGAVGALGRVGDRLADFVGRHQR